MIVVANGLEPEPVPGPPDMRSVENQIPTVGCRGHGRQGLRCSSDIAGHFGSALPFTAATEPNALPNACRHGAARTLWGTHLTAGPTDLGTRGRRRRRGLTPVADTRCQDVQSNTSSLPWVYGSWLAW
jgi:hypothetical protein